MSCYWKQHVNIPALRWIVLLLFVLKKKMDCAVREEEGTTATGICVPFAILAIIRLPLANAMHVLQSIIVIVIASHVVLQLILSAHHRHYSVSRGEHLRRVTGLPPHELPNAVDHTPSWRSSWSNNRWWWDRYQVRQKRNRTARVVIGRFETTRSKCHFVDFWRGVNDRNASQYEDTSTLESYKEQYYYWYSTRGVIAGRQGNVFCEGIHSNWCVERLQKKVTNSYELLRDEENTQRQDNSST